MAQPGRESQRKSWDPKNAMLPIKRGPEPDRIFHPLKATIDIFELL